MNKIWLIVQRDFKATVFTKAFFFGLLLIPIMIAISLIVVPKLINSDNFIVTGQVKVIDPTSLVVNNMELALTQGSDESQLIEAAREFNLDITDNDAFANALQFSPKLQVLSLPQNANLEIEKLWLLEEGTEENHLAIVVIHDNAIQANTQGEYGSFDVYIPPRLNSQSEIAVHNFVRESLINLRVAHSSYERSIIDTLTRVPRVNSVTVTRDGGEQTQGSVFNRMMPLVFTMLMFMGVMGGGQILMSSTIEEKSSRVIEVLLSAVSPMELMAGKLIAQMLVNLLSMGLYVAMGLVMLTSFSMFGLLDLSMILYLLIFFIISYFFVGSLMLAIGAAVNEMAEAQTFLMPLMLLLMSPFFLWMPVSNDPNSTLAVVTSFIPIMNSFVMLIRLTTDVPPPMWQIVLSIVTGLMSVVVAVWASAKILKIGLLLHGQAPNFKTLVRWVREA